MKGKGRIAPNGARLSSKEERVIDYLERYGSITAIEAETKLHDHRLAASVCTLRRKGYDIDTLRIDTVNVYGEETWYGKYVLNIGKMQ